VGVVRLIVQGKLVAQMDAMGHAEHVQQIKFVIINQIIQIVAARLIVLEKLAELIMVVEVSVRRLVQPIKFALGMAVAPQIVLGKLAAGMGAMKVAAVARKIKFVHKQVPVALLTAPERLAESLMVAEVLVRQPVHSDKFVIIG